MSPSRRLMQVGLVVLLLVGTVLATAVMWAIESDRAHDRGSVAADRAAAVLRLEIAASERSLVATAGLFDASSDVSAREFAVFARRTLVQATLYGTGWIEVVPHRDLRAYARRTGRAVVPPAGMSPRVLATPRDHYVITFSAPDPIGAVDAGSDAARRATLERAAVTGRPAVTPPLVIFGTTERGVVLYTPVYRGGAIPGTPRARRAALRGFVFGGFTLAPLLAPVVEAAGDVPVQVRAGDEVLAGGAVDHVAARRAVEFGGRTWTIVAAHPGTPLAPPLTILVAGLALTALASVLSRMHARRERYVTAEVRAATRDLRRSRSEYRSLLDNTPDVVARYDRDGRYLFVNRAIEDVTGLPPEWFAGRTLGDTGIPPDLRQTLTSSLERVFATGEPADAEFTFPGPDGPRVFHSHLTPETDPDGTVPSVLVVSRDVTRHRAAEDHLRASEARFRLVVGSMGDGVLVHDIRGRLLAHNAAAEEILGLTGAQLDGSELVGDGWRVVHEDGTPVRARDLPHRVAIRTGAPQANTVLGVDRSDGTRVWVNVQTGILPDGDPGGGHVVTCFTDVTERVRAEREHEVLSRVATLVASEAPGRAVFRLIAREAGPLVGADAAAVVRFDDDRWGELVGIWGADGVDTAPAGTTIDLIVPTTLRTVVRTREAATMADVTGEARHPAVVVRQRISAAATTPVRVGDRLWGALSVVTTGSRPLAPGALEMLGRLADLATMAIMSGEAREQLARLASTDHLTGLWNRRAFEDRLAAEIERARRHDRDLSLVVLDVDHFKRVNDTHGHPAGDRVLVEVAARLLGEVRSGEVVARVGGEEFAWILPETDAAGAVRAAERVRAAMASLPFPGVGTLTASFGVCELSEARDATELFRLADVALYWAKTQGRDRVFRYAQETLEILPPQEQEVRLERVRALASVRALAAAVDAKDASTMRHSERVADLAETLALRRGWSEAQAAKLREAALVHDVGKIAVPDGILLKAGPLTPGEYAQVKEHARIGAVMLADVLSPEQVAWVRGHHERFDGGGYPDGLSGDEISQGARILALADAWDAMTTARPYGAPLTPEAAMEECVRMSGSQFAPEVVEALRALLATPAVLAAEGAPGA